MTTATIACTANHDSGEIALGHAEPASRPAGPVGLRIRVHRWIMRRIFRLGMRGYLIALAAARWIHLPRRKAVDGRNEILLTGTFYSDNWIAAHLRPLAASTWVSRVCLVTDRPMPPMDKVEWVYSPSWLRRLAGGVPARLMTFAWTALRRRPQLVGGFHLLVNGLAAALLARVTGARSLYFCVGGPAEILDGGIWAENRLFRRLEVPDPIIEDRLIHAVRDFDLIVTMGTRAAEFFRQHHVSAACHVVPGAIDAGQFQVAQTAPQFDLILVGRLAEIKRIDVFLRAVQSAAAYLPGLSAVVVGDGERRPALQRLAGELGVADRVRFVGLQRDVGQWLRQARVFVLTSDSEGLALSLMEAMTCGLPCIVSNVGDLPDLVLDGVNGWLVPTREHVLFADRMVELLSNEPKRVAMSDAALRAAQRFTLEGTVRMWDEILGPPIPNGKLQA